MNPLGPNLDWLLLAGSLTLANLVVVERRGRQQPIGPHRQIELRSLLESMPESIVIIDNAAKIVDANGPASLLAGLTREQLMGMPISDFARHMDGETDRNVVKLQKPIAGRALDGEEVQRERRKVKHPQTGEMLDLLISANPIRNEKGEIQGALLMARDITDVSRLEQRIADIDRHQAIGQFAAGIAHDFNNTLQTISQAVAVLQMSPDRPANERKAFLDMIQNAVRRGAEVISRIRDYLRSGTAVVSDVDIRTLVEDAIELTRPMWQSAGIGLQRDLHCSALVRGNAADLRRVFTNLIINSVQATSKGGDITVGCEDAEKNIHVWVRDTGAGIAPELRKRVFNPYFTTKSGGTGLGLSGAQKILLELGGNISYSSEPGRGTQFDLYLPKLAEGEMRKRA